MCRSYYTECSARAAGDACAGGRRRRHHPRSSVKYGRACNEPRPPAVRPTSPCPACRYVMGQPLEPWSAELAAEHVAARGGGRPRLRPRLAEPTDWSTDGPKGLAQGPQASRRAEAGLWEDDLLDPVDDPFGPVDDPFGPVDDPFGPVDDPLAPAGGPRDFMAPVGSDLTGAARFDFLDDIRHPLDEPLDTLMDLDPLMEDMPGPSSAALDPPLRSDPRDGGLRPFVDPRELDDPFAAEGWGGRGRFSEDVLGPPRPRPAGLSELLDRATSRPRERTPPLPGLRPGLGWDPMLRDYDEDL